MALRTPAFNDAKTYGFEWLRFLAEVANLQEGVVGSGDFKATAAAAGLMRVDVAAGAAFIKGDSGTPAVGLSQGLFLLVNDAAIANAVTLATSDATNPRIDQIILKVRDSSDLATGADDVVLDKVTGTPTAGATLDNRTGAGALPNDAIRLADVLVPAASTSVTAGNVRDRRPWARGAHYSLLRMSGTNYTTTATSLVRIDATNLEPRVECSGVPVEVRLDGTVGNSTSSNVEIGLSVDAAELTNDKRRTPPIYTPLVARWVVTPAPGSHLFAPMYCGSTAGTTAVFNSGGYPIEFTVRELVAQNASNT